MDFIDEAVIANDQLPEGQRLTNKQLAEKIGSSERTVRRRRSRLRQRKKNRPVEGEDVFFGLPTDAITKRGKTVRLPDGSYEKIEWRPGAVEVADARKASYDDLKDIFVNPCQVEPKEGAKTLVIALSDFQIGKTDERGGTQETLARVTKMLNEAAATVAERGGYEEIVIADLGDSTEGFGNTVAQAQTDDLSLTDQIRIVTRLYAEAIRLFSPWSKRCWFISVPSNHCQVRAGVGSKQRVNAPDDDFGLMIADSLQLWAEGREELSHVTFAKPKKWEEALTLETIDGTAVGFTHGHLAGKQSKVGEWFADLAFGHRSGLHDAKILLHGHFHSFAVSYVGDARTVICAPSADNGSAWFTNVSGQSSPSELLTFEVQDGRSLNWSLYHG